MKRTSLFLISALVSVPLLGCGTNGQTSKTPNSGNTSTKQLSGSTPPKGNIEIDGTKYETKLGSYCWINKCVDTVGPEELLKDVKPVQVTANEQITFAMDFTPKPNEVHLSQKHKDDGTEVEVIDNHFTAPDQTGVYYYNYSVWWKDEKDEHLSHGSASYAFALEVQ